MSEAIIEGAFDGNNIRISDRIGLGKKADKKKRESKQVSGRKNATKKKKQQKRRKKRRKKEQGKRKSRGNNNDIAKRTSRTQSTQYRTKETKKKVPSPFFPSHQISITLPPCSFYGIILPTQS